MKKLLFVLFILGMFYQGNAQPDHTTILGKWEYNVVTDYSPMSGVLIFSEKEGKLSGEVAPAEGGLFPMTKVEVLEDNFLYFELKPEYDVIKVKVKIDGKKFKGTGSTYEGEFALSGEKKEK